MPKRPKRRRARNSAPQPTTITHPGVHPELYDITYNPMYSANINSRSVLGIPTYWRCVNLLANLPACLPARVIRGRGSNYRIDYGHVANRLLNETPDGEVNAEMYRRCCGIQLHVFGNSVSEILRNGRGDAGVLKYLENGMYSMYRDERRKRWYQFAMDNGQFSDPLPPDKAVHVAGFSLDGFIGRSAVYIHRETFERSITSTAGRNDFFAKGGRPSGVLSTEKTNFGPNEKEKMREEWNESLPNGTAILTHGTKYQPIGIPPEDTKFLAGFQWDAELICQIMGVPPYMVGIYKSGNEIKAEELALHFMTNTLIPLIRWWEAEWSMKLFASNECRIELDLNHLIRASISAQGEFISKMTAAGGFVPDDTRMWLGKDPHPDGIGSIPLIGANNFARLQDVIEGKTLKQGAGSEPSNNPGRPANLGEDQFLSILNNIQPANLVKLAKAMCVARGYSQAETDAVLNQAL